MPDQELDECKSYYQTRISEVSRKLQGYQYDLKLKYAAMNSANSGTVIHTREQLKKLQQAIYIIQVTNQELTKLHGDINIKSSDVGVKKEVAIFCNKYNKQQDNLSGLLSDVFKGGGPTVYSTKSDINTIGGIMTEIDMLMDDTSYLPNRSKREADEMQQAQRRARQAEQERRAMKEAQRQQEQERARQEQQRLSEQEQRQQEQAQRARREQQRLREQAQRQQEAQRREQEQFVRQEEQQKQLQRLQTENKQLRDQLKERDEQGITLAALIVKEQEVANKQAQLGNEQEKFSKDQQSLASERKAIKQEQDGLVKDKQAAQEYLTEATKKLENATATEKKATDKLSAANAEVKHLENTKSQLTSEISRLTAEKDQLSNENASLKSEHEQLQTQMQGARVTADAANNKAKQSQAKLESMKQEIREDEKRLGEIQEQIESQQARLGGLQLQGDTATVLQERERAITEQEQALTAREKEIDEKATELNTRDTSLQEQRKQLTAQSTALVSREHKVAQSEGGLKEREDKAAQKEAELQKRESSLAQQEQLLKQVAEAQQKAFAEKEQGFKDKTEALNDGEAKVEARKKELEAKQNSENDDLRVKNEELKKRNETLQENLDEYKKTIQKNKETNDLLMGKLNKKNQELPGLLGKASKIGGCAEKNRKLKEDSEALIKQAEEFNVRNNKEFPGMGLLFQAEGSQHKNLNIMHQVAPSDIKGLIVELTEKIKEDKLSTDGKISDKLNDETYGSLADKLDARIDNLTQQYASAHDTYEQLRKMLGEQKLVKDKEQQEKQAPTEKKEIGTGPDMTSQDIIDYQEAVKREKTLEEEIKKLIEENRALTAKSNDLLKPEDANSQPQSEEDKKLSKPFGFSLGLQKLQAATRTGTPGESKGKLETVGTLLEASGLTPSLQQSITYLRGLLESNQKYMNEHNDFPDDYNRLQHNKEALEGIKDYITKKNSLIKDANEDLKKLMHPPVPGVTIESKEISQDYESRDFKPKRKKSRQSSSLTPLMPEPTGFGFIVNYENNLDEENKNNMSSAAESIQSKYKAFFNKTELQSQIEQDFKDKNFSFENNGNLQLSYKDSAGNITKEHGGKPNRLEFMDGMNNDNIALTVWTLNGVANSNKDSEKDTKARIEYFSEEDLKKVLFGLHEDILTDIDQKIHEKCMVELAAGEGCNEAMKKLIEDHNNLAKEINGMREKQEQGTGQAPTPEELSNLRDEIKQFNSKVSSEAAPAGPEAPSTQNRPGL